MRQYWLSVIYANCDKICSVLRIVVIFQPVRLYSAYISLRKLAVVELRIESVLCEQLLVRALLGDLAVLHDENAVGVADGREPVRHDERGAPLHECIERILNFQFSSGVYR